MKLLAFLAVILVLFAGCINTPFQAKGTLQGHISIGPLCPVESNPPEPNCLPNEETYLAYPLTVYENGPQGPGQLIEVARFVGDKDGNYSLELRAGTYIIRQNSVSQMPSKVVEVKENQVTTLDFEIDTGIR